MNKFLAGIFGLVGIIVLIDMGVGKAGDYLQTHPRGGVTRRTNDLVQKECHDIVVFGSSRAHHHYDTPFLSDTLEMDVYNAGYNGNGVVLAYGLLEMILERYLPKLIILDMEPSFDLLVYSADGDNVRYISTLKPYFRHPVIGEMIRSISTEEWYKVHSGMLRYNSCLAEMGVDFLSGHGREPKGFSPLKDVYSQPVSPRVDEGTIDSLKFGYMEKFIRAAQKKSVPLVLVASPKLGIHDASVLTPAKELCEQFGIPFVDYYAASDFQNPAFFADPIHMNDKGARLFSERLVHDLWEVFHPSAD